MKSSKIISYKFIRIHLNSSENRHVTSKAPIEEKINISTTAPSSKYKTKRSSFNFTIARTV